MAVKNLVEALVPETLDEALELKAKLGPKAEWVAGGTDLVLKLRMGRKPPRALIRVPACNGEPVEEKAGIVHVSARAPVAALLESKVLAVHVPLLVQALSNLGSPLVRNLATIGGNLGNASPCCESGPPLLVHKTLVAVCGPARSRVIPIEHFFIAPGKTALAQDEIIDEVLVQSPGREELVTYRKFGPRRANVIASANLACRAFVERGIVQEAMLAAGSVAPTPVRLPLVEKVLAGKAVRDLDSPAVNAELEAAVEAEIRPISDVRGSAWYKTRTVANAVCFAAALISSARSK